MIVRLVPFHLPFRLATELLLVLLFLRLPVPRNSYGIVWLHFLFCLTHLALHRAFAVLFCSQLVRENFGNLPSIENPVKCTRFSCGSPMSVILKRLVACSPSPAHIYGLTYLHHILNNPLNLPATDRDSINIYVHERPKQVNRRI